MSQIEELLYIQVKFFIYIPKWYVMSDELWDEQWGIFVLLKNLMKLEVTSASAWGVAHKGSFFNEVKVFLAHTLIYKITEGELMS